VTAGKSRYGLVALAAGSIETPSDTLVDCVRTHEPAGMLMEVSTELTACSEDGMTLGTGQAKWMVRDNDAETLALGNRPAGDSDWTHVVYNPNKRAITVGTLIRAQYYMGVGLVMDVTPSDFPFDIPIAQSYTTTFQPWTSSPWVVNFDATEINGPDHFEGIDSTGPPGAAPIDHIEGFTLLESGVYLVWASVVVKGASSPDTFVIVEDDLGTDLAPNGFLWRHEQGEFYMTLNDPGPVFVGNNQIVIRMPFAYTSMCGMRGAESLSAIGLITANAGDKLRLFHTWSATATSDAKPVGTWGAGMGAMFIKDPT